MSFNKVESSFDIVMIITKKNTALSNRNNDGGFVPSIGVI